MGNKIPVIGQSVLVNYQDNIYIFAAAYMFYVSRCKNFGVFKCSPTVLYLALLQIFPINKRKVVPKRNKERTHRNGRQQLLP